MALSRQTIALMKLNRHWVPTQNMYKTQPTFHAARARLSSAVPHAHAQGVGRRKRTFQMPVEGNADQNKPDEGESSGCVLLHGPRCQLCVHRVGGFQV